MGYFVQPRNSYYSMIRTNGKFIKFLNSINNIIASWLSVASSVLTLLE